MGALKSMLGNSPEVMLTRAGGVLAPDLGLIQGDRVGQLVELWTPWVQFQVLVGLGVPPVQPGVGLERGHGISSPPFLSSRTGSPHHLPYTHQIVGSWSTCTQWPPGWHLHNHGEVC